MKLDEIQNEFSLTDEKIEFLQRYATVLLEWNKTHNLSGTQTLQEVYCNILDSIYPLKFIQDFKSCIDIGSGAGFPAIPLAICKSEARFLLVEPRVKRVSFLKNLIVELGLENIEVQKCLIEHLVVASEVDLITSRAVMSTNKLIEKAGRFLKKGGYYLFYKGTQLDLEMEVLESECFYRDKRVYFYRKD